ncbi:unnamed protein product [Rotaria sp. Silwood2]|nr:unnamed protein product [Rotaria sp. Silwood2]
MDSDNKVMPTKIIANKVTGIFFENKAEYTTWFGANPEFIHGIQMIPCTPITEEIRLAKFVKEEWTTILSKIVHDAFQGWKSILIRERNSHELYWDDLNKAKFLSLLTASSLVVRTCFHPLGLIKIRLQTRAKGGLSTVYMIQQVWCKEGPIRGFYRGFPISLCSLIFEPVFTAALEKTRTILKSNRPSSITHSQWDIITSTLSGCTATLIYQSLTVPIDVTSQRIIITRARDDVHVANIIHDIYYRSGDGIRGFYKGYLVSLSMTIPYNSIMWTIYWRIQAKLERIIPFEYDRIVAPLSAIMASLLTSLLTQPIDVLKTRLQVASKRQSLWRTFRILIDERGLRGCFSGSLPRACILVPYSIIMMSLYEIIKRTSVRPTPN